MFEYTIRGVKNMRGKILMFSLCILVLLSLGACSSGEGENSAYKADDEELSFGLDDEPGSLEPTTIDSTSSRTVKLAIYRGLFSHENGEVTPELVESYDTNDDETSYTFKLKDATFHNGDPVTADDVKFTFERILASDSRASFKDELSIISDIEVEDDKTIKFKLKKAYAPFLDYLALPESVIVSEKWTEEHDLQTEPMGAGPFKLVEWNQGRNLVVEKNDDYYKEGKPKLNKIEFSFYTDDDTRINALKSEDVDLVSSVPTKSFEEIRNESDLKMDETVGPFMGLMFNTHFEPFEDRKVRQAIAYAVDREAVINTAFNKEGEPLYGLPISEDSIGYEKKYTDYFHKDVDKAKTLLKEAGYPDGFKATLLASSDYSMHEQTAIAVQDALKEVGIDIELELPDWATRSDRTSSGDYDFVVTGTSADITDPDWWSSYIQGKEPSLNTSAYFDDEEINDLISKGREETDEKEREKIYSKLYERTLDQSPFVFINWRKEAYGMKKSVQGFKNLEGFMSFQSGITLEDAYIE